MGLFSAVADAIDAHTGLSPAAFFTVAALAIGAYRLVSSLFVAPEAPPPPPAQPPPPPAEPVQMGDVTLEELKAFDGSDPKKPLLMAIKGQIYDVSRSRMFYGPGGPYALFSGNDATRALALMSFDSKDLTSNIDGLSAAELDTLQDWEYKFMEKYVKVGQVVSHKTAKGEGTQIMEGDSALDQKEVSPDVMTKDKEQSHNCELLEKNVDPDVVTEGAKVNTVES